MRRDAATRLIALLSATAIISTACSTVREIVGMPANDPSVTLRPSEPKWLLIKNPRYGDIPSEPEYIWVEEDNVPFTMKGLVLGKKSLIAPPDVVAKYGSPPGGGRISPRQGGPYQIESAVPTVATSSRGPVAAVSAPTRTDAASATKLNRGFVVYVDTTRFVIDLNSSDGVRAGSTVSVRRDKIAIVHPITGELLGELDEEVATGKVTEVRDKFSVVEIENVSSGAQVKVKDRVVVR